jgi:predicted hotdog family 3-hydroxylacyl-ACP dehydratase
VPLDRDWIESHIPHAGSMCLLDEVLSWDPGHIECRSATHRATENPLRAYGRLGSICGVEYAAQSMAVHGALVAGRISTPAVGYLAALRAVVLHVGRLDDLAEDLLIRCERINGDAATVMYQFCVRSGAHSVVSGRATIILDAAALARAEDAPLTS